MDGLCVSRPLFLFEWIEMSATLEVD